MEETPVIELEHNQVNYTGDGTIILETIEEEPPSEKKVRERCQFIKKNGKQCRQTGKETQSGGPIIDGYCNYHRPEKNELRENSDFLKPN